MFINEKNIQYDIEAAEQELLSIYEEIGVSDIENRMISVMAVLLEMVRFLNERYKH